MQAYALCIAAFISIWLIFDISDHISRFLGLQHVVGRGAPILSHAAAADSHYSSARFAPARLLFSLGRMSRTNEIVSMLTAGVSIPRVLLPLIGAGVATTIFAGVLNYSLAPHAEQAQKMYFDRARASGIVGQLFRNRRDNRTWFIQQFRPTENQFTTVQVLQQDANDNIISNHLAASASYDEAARAWDLKGVKVVNYDATGNITSEENAESMRITEWSETPFRLASTNMRAEFLSFQELRDYLHFNSDFPRNLLAPFVTHLHYRIALPWTCLIVVFIAAPLAIGFTRGGVLSNVAGSDRPGVREQFPDAFLPRARRRQPHPAGARGMDAQRSLRDHRRIAPLGSLD
jgi:hypothetical protein